MISIPLIVCVIGLLIYFFATTKTRQQFAEDVGRIAFWVGLLVALLGTGKKLF